MCAPKQQTDFMNEYTTAPAPPQARPLTVDSFDFVRRGVQSLLAGHALHNNLEGLYLSPGNLQYIFNEYVRRYENETGWQIDDQTHRLDAFTQLIHDAYVTGMCKYRAPKDSSRIAQAEIVQQWNEDTINAIVFEAVKETRKKVNYLRRARDPLYGRRTWNPIHLAKPSVEKMEDGFRFAYREQSKAKYPYSFSVPDDG